MVTVKHEIYTQIVYTYANWSLTSFKSIWIFNTLHFSKFRGMERTKRDFTQRVSFF